MPATFDLPWLLLAVPITLFVIVWLAWRGPSETIPRPRRLAIAGTRGVVVVALALVLAGPRLPATPQEDAPADEPADAANVEESDPPDPDEDTGEADERSLVLGVLILPPWASTSQPASPWQAAAAEAAREQIEAGIARETIDALAVVDLDAARLALHEPGTLVEAAPWPWGGDMGDAAIALALDGEGDSRLLSRVLALAIKRVEVEIGDAAVGEVEEEIARVTRVVLWGAGAPARSVTGGLSQAGYAWRFEPLPLPAPLPVAEVLSVTTRPSPPLAGRPFALTVTMLSAAIERWRLEVRIVTVDGDATPPDAGAVALVPDTVRPAIATATLRDLTLPEGCAALTFTLTPIAAESSSDEDAGDRAEPLPEPIIDRRGLIIEPPRRWLIVGATEGNARDHGLDWIADRAREYRHEVDRLPHFPPDLSRYHGAVCSLEELLDIEDDTLAQLTNWVIDGGAALHVTTGGNDFVVSKERYRRLAPLLPARLLGPPEAREDSPTDVGDDDVDVDVPLVSLLLLIDNSGSMASLVANRFSRMHYVREAAKLAVDAMDAKDRITIYTFDKVPRLVLSPRAIGDDESRDEIDRTIDGMPGAAGWTWIIGACREARRALADETAAVKHVILISDGEDTVEPLGDFAALRREFQEAGIGVSVIGIGRADARTLLQLATDGFEYLTDAEVAAADTPAIPQFVIDTYRHARVRGAIRQAMENDLEIPPELIEPEPERGLIAYTGAYPVRPVVTPAYFAGVPENDWPNVKGYIAARPWKNAMTLLRIVPENGEPRDNRANTEGDPLLCSWRLGLGEVSLFTSGFDEWSAPAWLNWGYAPALVDAWLRATGARDAGRFRLRDGELTTAGELPKPARDALIAAGIEIARDTDIGVDDDDTESERGTPDRDRWIFLMARVATPMGATLPWATDTGDSAWQVHRPGGNDNEIATTLGATLVAPYLVGEPSPIVPLPWASGPDNRVVIAIPSSALAENAGLALTITDRASDTDPTPVPARLALVPLASAALAMPTAFDWSHWQPQTPAAIQEGAPRPLIEETPTDTGNNGDDPAIDVDTPSESASDSPSTDTNLDATLPAEAPPAIWFTLVCLMLAVAAVPLEVFLRR